MPPAQPLPLSGRFSTTTSTDAEDYVESLLAFCEHPLLRTLCGGIHILDFFTRDSADSADPADPAVPQDIYRTVIPPDWIEFFARQPHIDGILDLLLRTPPASFPADVPPSLATYIYDVREHSLRRDFVRRAASERTRRTVGYGTEWALNAGMRPKKIHEVENFAAFLDDLARDIQSTSADAGADADADADADAGACAKTGGISHVVDYGSGQAYLSRTLAKKYGRNVVGLESRTVNIEGAKTLDRMYDSIAVKKLRYKRRVQAAGSAGGGGDALPEAPAFGSLQYVQTVISDGNLDRVVEAIDRVRATQPGDGSGDDGTQPVAKPLLLTSLHSCGNLVHHALDAFRNTPSVRAVALIGCCYNLMTEKHGASFKPPFLRVAYPRLVAAAAAGDPHGFPISARLAARHVRFNITARSMACQAPLNWTSSASASFFRSHFYRALLQRIFLDRGLISLEAPEPVVVGSLPKPSYAGFHAYCVAAVAKLGWQRRCPLTPDETAAYERRFGARRRELEVVWSLMAFSAAVVESAIAVDRWLFLREMGCRHAWVEAAFDHAVSPRNLVVVGVR